MAKKEKLIGEAAFEKYYSEIFNERWEKLKEAFKKENDYITFQKTSSTKAYYLDSASVTAASMLPLEDATDILDLCAAPGGKTLILASRMNKDAHLSANERSPERKHRLSTVVSESLPEDISSRILTSCSDGATWCKRQTECFDAILLDAPCSSERHVIADPKYLNVWTENRVKTVASEQWALLSCAFRLLRPEGYLLYSTCALCPKENDEMIDRLLKKFPGQVSIEEPKADSKVKDFTNLKVFPDAEKTEHGYHILPDTSEGAGPIYFCLIKKTVV